MTHIITASALALALGVGVAEAQTATTPAADPTAPAAAPTTLPPPAITAPEGFLAEKVVFSSDNLDGATVYDATGQQIGEVHALVFSNSETSKPGLDSTPGATMSAATPDAATASVAPAQSDTVTGTATPVPDAGAASEADMAASATDPANPDTGTMPADNERISGVGSDAGTVTPTDATTPPTQTPDAAAAVDARQSGEVTEAVIDVGGFLGMGEHRVAVPVKELVAYRKENELRIYLPWTREQLLALPRFEEKAPA